MEWPSLTVEWLPDKTTKSDNNENMAYSIQRLLLATHTNDTEQDYIIFAA